MVETNRQKGWQLNHIFSAWAILILAAIPSLANAQRGSFTLPLPEYEDKVHAIWAGQMIAAIMGWPFEHSPAAVQTVNDLHKKDEFIPVDDDWYYEMVAIRAFEKYGASMTVDQLGVQWVENTAGTWGSSEQALLLMKKGIKAGDAGHPRYNRLWFTIGPQFSADVYGALAPGMPNLAAAMARQYGHINGYAEAVDGGVFVAGMVSLGFYDKDPKSVVRKAANLISPLSPYRQCLDMVIGLADQGKTYREVVNAVEDRWHMEYPATNNAVANGGIVAASVWFGEGDFLKTVNLAFEAADFSDADCNAANAAAVLGAMHGTKGIPERLLRTLGDRIKDDTMGEVKLTPAVDESLSGLARRTAAIGKAILNKHGARQANNALIIRKESPETQAAELFSLSGLTQYWNADWKLERAGFGGAGGGLAGIRGITYLDGEVLATYPRDEVRGALLEQTLDLTGKKELSFEAGTDPKRTWELNVYVDNKRVLKRFIEGKDEQERQWYPVKIDLSAYDGKKVTIRLFQRVLIKGKEAGNAYWKNIQVL